MTLFSEGKASELKDTTKEIQKVRMTHQVY